MHVQRPDQRFIPTAPGTVPGSRSGAAEIGTTLQASGIPPIVPGLLSVNSGPKGAGTWQLIAFAQPARIWGVMLTASLSSHSGYAGTSSDNASFTVEAVTVNTINDLAAIELAVSGPSQTINGQAPPLVFGLDVAQGDVINLNVNNSTVITNATMRANAIIFYTVP